ncbi:hypothetical protein [Vibrio crassostreae]|uniref:hypothetical protein n=1 Tax=Vibrio crassostreae TaxID=246167 RepID=UPI001B30D094|nr:hypothetical protein [Vibrio crassostreae]
MTELSESAKARLHSQLIKLGDMMGDGLHLEPDGKWISRDYKKVSQALGIAPKTTRKNNGEEIDQKMAEALKDKKCPNCQSDKLEQTRKGSMRAKCGDCKQVLQFKRSGKRK